MNAIKKSGLKAIMTLILILLVGGCSANVTLRTAVKPSDSKRQFLSLKKIAVLPVNNIAGEKGAEEKAMGIIINELNIRKTFEEVEDPRFVANIMKALKLRQITELDKETVSKLGSESSSQALLICDIHAWGLGQGTEAAQQVSILFTLIDSNTGKPIWIGNGAKRKSFTWSRVFGLNEGPTDMEVARSVITSLVENMDSDIQEKREVELSRIKEEEEAKLKAAAEAEKRRLEELMKEEK